MPRLYNIHRDKDIPKGSVNIMRPGPHGNPFIIGRDGTRDECCDKHKEWVDHNPVYKRVVRKELRGKNLICCCAPNRCHGEYLLKVANR